MGTIGELLMPDMYDAVQSGIKDGQARYQQNTLRQYAQPALNGDQGALAKIYGADPDAGLKVQNQQGKLQDAAKAQLAEFTSTVARLAKSGDMNAASNYYSANVGALSAATGMHLGPQLDPSMVPHITNIADALNPQQAKEGFTLGANQVRYGADGKQIAAGPQQAPKDPEAIATLKALQGDPNLMATWQKTHPRAPTSGGGGYGAGILSQDEVSTAGLPAGTVVQRDGKGKLTILSKPNTLSPDKMADVAVKRQKVEQAKQESVATFNDSINKIDGLLNDPSFGSLGTFTGDIASRIPHTDTANAKAALDTISAQSVINVLSSLKSLSANGASGFGALSEKEGEILRNAAANLSTSQGNAAIKKNLLELKQKLARSRDRIAAQEVKLPEDSISGGAMQPQPAVEQGQPMSGGSPMNDADPLGLLK